MSKTTDSPKGKTGVSAGKSSAQASENDERNYIDDQELHVILEQHEKWLKSAGKSGEKASLEGRCLWLADQPARILVRANLRKANLRGVIFGNVNLFNADLSKADLSNATFEGTANLQLADFRGSKLSRVDFASANLSDAKFRGARLDGANLGSVEKLLPIQLAATDLTRTTLPEIACTFPAVEQVNKITYLGRSTFLMLLTASIIALFVVGTTEDVELLSGGVAETLPIVNIELPLVEFIHVAPLFVLALYLYLTLYLVMLMDELSELPAIFPDGRTLDQHVEPWVMTSLIYKEMPNLHDYRPSLSYLRQYGALVVGWCTAPVILISVWWYYIRAHELWSSVFHVLLVVTSIYLGVVTYRKAIFNLRGQYYRDEMKLDKYRHYSAALHSLGLVLGLILAVGLTRHAIEAPLSRSKPQSTLLSDFTAEADVRTPEASTSPGGFYSSVWNPMQSFHANLDMMRFLDISESDVTGRPVVWSDPLNSSLQESYEKIVNWKLPSETPYEQTQVLEQLRSWQSDFSDFVTGSLNSSGVDSADLSERDLRHIRATRAFLAMSDLSNSNLTKAIFTEADFRGAQMNGIQAYEADFTDSKMQGVVLTLAQLQGAQLINVDLTGAKMEYVNLQPFDSILVDNMGTQVAPVEAVLNNSTMKHAILDRAKLNHATLIQVDLTYATMIETVMVGALLDSAILDHAILSGADLQGATLSNTDMKHTDLSPVSKIEIDASGMQVNRLVKSNLQGVTLVNAELQHADLSHVNLKMANLAGAIIHDVRLDDADLTGAIGLSQEQLDGACGNDKTILPAGFTIESCQTPE